MLRHTARVRWDRLVVYPLGTSGLSTRPLVVYPLGTSDRSSDTLRPLCFGHCASCVFNVLGPQGAPCVSGRRASSSTACIWGTALPSVGGDRIWGTEMYLGHGSRAEMYLGYGTLLQWPARAEILGRNTRNSSIENNIGR